jgi:predicted ATP-grasp superfamily ATP-dependent carboligase
MRILVHEWCCSGGLAAWQHGRGVEVAADLQAEGRAMFLALLRDACRDPELEVTALVDATRPVPLPAQVRIRSVAVGAEVDMLVAEALRADTTIVVAPETDGLLASRVAAVRQAGGAVLASDAAFLAVAADKQATVHALAAAGVPVPAGRLLAAGAEWPAGFCRPAVRKRRDGVGGEDLVVVPPGARPPAPVPRDARLEVLAEGVPVGVACLCGDGPPLPLAPLRQRFAAGPGSAYAGGEPLADRAAQRRATALAVRAIAAVTQSAGGRARGWVGVDMILGPRADGRGDRVLEVNPRLTTSFVGHATAAATSLVRQSIDVAAGRTVMPAASPGAFQVVANGDCSFSRD